MSATVASQPLSHIAASPGIGPDSSDIWEPSDEWKANIWLYIQTRCAPAVDEAGQSLTSALQGVAPNSPRRLQLLEIYNSKIQLIRCVAEEKYASAVERERAVYHADKARTAGHRRNAPSGSDRHAGPSIAQERTAQAQAQAKVKTADAKPGGAPKVTASRENTAPVTPSRSRVSDKAAPAAHTTAQEVSPVGVALDSATPAPLDRSRTSDRTSHLTTHRHGGSAAATASAGPSHPMAKQRTTEHPTTVQSPRPMQRPLGMAGSRSRDDSAACDHTVPVTTSRSRTSDTTAIAANSTARGNLAAGGHVAAAPSYGHAPPIRIQRTTEHAAADGSGHSSPLRSQRAADKSASLQLGQRPLGLASKRSRADSAASDGARPLRPEVFRGRDRVSSGAREDEFKIRSSSLRPARSADPRAVETHSRTRSVAQWAPSTPPSRSRPGTPGPVRLPLKQSDGSGSSTDESVKRPLLGEATRRHRDRPAVPGHVEEVRRAHSLDPSRAHHTPHERSPQLAPANLPPPTSETKGPPAQPPAMRIRDFAFPPPAVAKSQADAPPTITITPSRPLAARATPSRELSQSPSSGQDASRPSGLMRTLVAGPHGFSRMGEQRRSLSARETGEERETATTNKALEDPSPPAILRTPPAAPQSARAAHPPDHRHERERENKASATEKHAGHKHKAHPSPSDNRHAHPNVHVKVITRDAFVRHEGFDLTPPVHYPLFKSRLPGFEVPKEALWSELRRKVAQPGKLSPESFRLWSVTHRPNGTLRPKTLLRDQDHILPIDKARDKSRAEPTLVVYLEMIPDHLKGRQHTEHTQHALVFLKYFDATRQMLRGVGQLYAPRSLVGSDLRVRILHSLQWEANTKIRLYKEVNPGTIESKLAHEPWINVDGDIICFQLDITRKQAQEIERKGLHPDSVSYYNFLCSRVQGLFEVNTNDKSSDSGEHSPSSSQLSLSSEADSEKQGPPTAEEWRLVALYRVELEHLVRCLVQVNDKLSVFTWLATYLRNCIYSMRGKVFQKAMLGLQDKHASEMLTFLQSILDHPNCYEHASASDSSGFRSVMLRLLLRLTRQSDSQPSSLFITGVDVDFTKDPVAHGGFASVFLGTLDKAKVALKRLRLDAKLQQEILDKFYREALLWRQLKHRFVLPFVGLFSPSGSLSDSPCMVSPWMARGTLLHYARTMDISHGGREKILAQTAEGLAYLHSRSIVHGDIKGLNIFVNDEGKPQLADFGLAVISESAVGLTVTTNVGDGTVRWMAPELIDPSANHQLTSASDAWAFGCLCLEVFTLEPPFSPIHNHFAVILAIVGGKKPRRPTDVECRGRAMSDSLWDLVYEQCWARSPFDRANLDTIAARLHECHV